MRSPFTSLFSFCLLLIELAGINPVKAQSKITSLFSHQTSNADGQESDTISQASQTLRFFCPAPTTASTYFCSSKTIAVEWGDNNSDAVSYRIRWRPVSEVTWLESPLITGPEKIFFIRNLIHKVNYEWQVKAICTDNESVYSETLPVTTGCQPPFLWNIAKITDSTAALSWFGGGDELFEVSYRKTNSTDWTNIRTTGSYLYTNVSFIPTVVETRLALTQLMPGTNYEYKVRTICSDGSPTAYTPDRSFSTREVCSTLKAGSWTDPTVWSCARTPTGTDVVQVQHRVTIPAKMVGLAFKIRYNNGGIINLEEEARLLLNP